MYIALTLIPVKISFSTNSWIASNDVIWRLCDELERMVQQVFLNFTVQDVINCTGTHWVHVKSDEYFKILRRLFISVYNGSKLWSFN